MSNDARQAILGSIRTHLAASVPYDPVNPANPVILSEDKIDGTSVDLFRQNLELVDGHCIIARSETEIAQSLTRIITNLNRSDLRVAISEIPLINRVMHLTDLEIEAMTVAPDASEIFSYDVGITTAQAAIAETGTLVLDSADERHRLVSLVPPVHIAIVDASRIVRTLGEALSLLRDGKEISPAVTFITGPSRTADIELTLTIGVHGPQELYVIVYEN